MDAQTPLLVIADEADRPTTDFDVLMCYQIFLGRDPESSFVIQDCKTHPLRKIITGFLDSPEFVAEVLPNFANAGRLPHEPALHVPTPQHQSWLCRCFVLDDRQRQAVGKAQSWTDLFSALFPTLDASWQPPAAHPSASDEAADTPPEPAEGNGAILSRLDRLEREISEIKAGLSRLSLSPEAQDDLKANRARRAPGKKSPAV